MAGYSAQEYNYSLAIFCAPRKNDYMVRLGNLGYWEVAYGDIKKLVCVIQAGINYVYEGVYDNYASLFSCVSLDGTEIRTYRFEYNGAVVNYSPAHPKETKDYVISNYLIPVFGSEYTFREISYADVPKWILENKTSFHTDPVYVDKTKVNYTDGTYSIKDGALDATKARSEGYKYLLNTYGTFYRGTEEELSNSFITGLPDINGGGGN